MGHAFPQTRKIKRVENRGPITDCLIHIVTIGLKLPIPVVNFSKEICHHLNRITLRKVKESSTSVLATSTQLAAAQEVTGQRKCHNS